MCADPQVAPPKYVPSQVHAALCVAAADVVAQVAENAGAWQLSQSTPGDG